ncbi:MAG: tRNA (guanosine(46)-N7)-methyltransferase TrmB [Casimicrobiaceae bacterium]
MTDVPPSADAPVHRPVRSFVRRAGRQSPSQKRALDEFAPRHCIDHCRAPLDFAAVFGRHASVVLEIGFGMGETTAQIAAAHPDIDYIAVDVHDPGIGSLLGRIEALGLCNLRIVRHDAVEVVADMIPPGSLAGVHVYFPDPWPKKRHHKRRLLKPAFVHEIALRVASGGYLHAATDWQEYADEILAVFAAEPLLANSAAGFAPRPAWRPQTKFETRGLALGHAVSDILFTRNDS